MYIIALLGERARKSERRQQNRDKTCFCWLGFVAIILVYRNGGAFFISSFLSLPFHSHDYDMKKRPWPCCLQVAECNSIISYHHIKKQ